MSLLQADRPPVVRSTPAASRTAAVRPAPACASQASRDLRERVLRALEESGYPQLRRVAVKVVDGVVILEGRISSYYGKQLAQTFSLAVDGVQALENRLSVEY